MHEPQCETGRCVCGPTELWTLADTILTVVSNRQMEIRDLIHHVAFNHNYGFDTVRLKLLSMLAKNELRLTPDRKVERPIVPRQS